MSAVDLPTGAHIEYVESGDGTPVVYFHGAGGVFRNAAFIPELARRFRVLAPSRPGYDGSTGSCASSREEAEVMAEFIRTVVSAPVHLIAESAGAAAGCWLSILSPELVQSLTLVAPTAFAGTHHAPPPASPEAMEHRLFGATPAWSTPPTDEDRAARQRNAQNNAARLRPADGNADLRARLPDISVPTLVVWGTADELIPPAASNLYIQQIPNSYRILIYRAAHSIPIAACRQFVALVEDFLTRGDRFVVAEPAPSP